MKIKKIILCSFLALMLPIGDALAQKSPVDYVNPFIGTGFHGHTYPGATVPYGAVQLSPDTRLGNWDACSGYHYNDSTILGFSHTHLSGTGCLDLGDILFHPTTKEVLTASKGDLYQPLRFSHEQESASPGYYSVEFKDEKIKAELTASTHVGVHRYSFPTDCTASIIIDLFHSLDNNEFIYEATLEKCSDNEIVGMRRTRGWVDNQCVYFVAQFSKSFKKVDFYNAGSLASAGNKQSGTNLQAVVGFDVTDGTPVVVKVALSVVSIENARENLKKEVSGFDFDAVKRDARTCWEKALSEITVEGNNKEDLINFYTAVYHSKVIPNIVNDVNGDYRRHDMTIARLGKGECQYSTFSIWDTFRAWHPLITLTDTAMVRDMIHSFLNIYDASGELPIWPLSAGETGTMIGYHAVSVIADAYLKGIRGFDAEKALKAMIVSSEKNKKGADFYIKYGFIPSNTKRESVSCLLEFAYDDWAIAQMAKAMGKEDIYQRYIKRSQNYCNVFDGQTKFFRGKRMDGNWETPFNPFEVGRAYTEATAWQYRFFVPHDVNGMIQLFGGKEAFIKELDQLFVVESNLHNSDIQDITGLIGQYAHGNEPSHHMAYLYNYVGQPWKTQEMVRRILKEMYKPTPDGIIGNEDCGQMSAWYILSSLGLYSVCPGSNEYSLTAPLFCKATIHLANGKTLTITANCSEENKYIDKVVLNGKEIETNFITYKQLMEGGEFCFTLFSQPNLHRGTGVEAAPYSYTKGKMVSVPCVDKDLNLFLDKTEVQLMSATPGAEIRYTLNGTEPTPESPLYKKPLSLKQSAWIIARAYKNGYQPSRILSIHATKAEFRKAEQVAPVQNGTSFSYYEGLYSKVDDIEKSPVVMTGIMKEPSIDKARQEDHFAYIFTGMLYIPEDGVYGFNTCSDDGSVLYIGNEKVVDNDGSHAAIEATGKIALKKGFHSYKLLYFEDYEGQGFSWAWKTPASKQFTIIPAKNLFVKK
ncbi:GH92 family glycosyl hydrolase [Bacteroides sedimenti]|uniref:Alpha-1 2-mannosidase n=1 Tax=Bacteroides sedimenti TaxID=2136147 RepID=A0ABN6Z3V8_9BACE